MIAVTRTRGAGGNPGPSTLDRDEDMSDVGSSSNQQEMTYLMDISKPEGDACRKDGTLKDADEMEWPNSPTEYNQPLPIEYGDQFSDLEFPKSPSEDNTSCELGDKRKRSEMGDKTKRKHLASKKSESESDEAPKAKVRYFNCI